DLSSASAELCPTDAARVLAVQSTAKTKGGSGFPEPPSERQAANLAAELGNVLGGRTLLALDDLELHALTLGQGAETRALNRRVMDEAILLPALRRDETKTFRIVEPLDRAGRTHCRILLQKLKAVV